MAPGAVDGVSMIHNGGHRRAVTGIDAPSRHERQLTDLGGMMDTLTLNEKAMLPTFLNGLTVGDSGLSSGSGLPPPSNSGLPGSAMTSNAGLSLSSSNTAGLPPILNGGLLQPSSSTNLMPPGLVVGGATTSASPPGLSILSNSPSPALSSPQPLVPAMMENARPALIPEKMATLPQPQPISGSMAPQTPLIPSMVPAQQQQQSIQEKMEQQLVQEKQQQVIKAQQDQIEQLKAQLQQQQRNQQSQPPPIHAPPPTTTTTTRPEDTNTTTTSYTGRIPSNKQDSRKLFVGGLPAEITDESFLRFFETYGPVIDSVVLLDRRTKRSRGFGFVTFRDEEVALQLLNVIPGRTGRVAMNGKMCEIKASEPKTEENTYDYHRRFGGGHTHTPHHHPSRGYYYGQPHPGMIPYNTFSPEGNPAIYSHSTVTRANGTEGGEGGGGQPSVYIQNNYYTLPSSEGGGGGAPGENVGEGYPTPMQQQQQQHAPFAYPGGAAWEPSYPGPVEDGGEEVQGDYFYGGHGM